MTTIRPGRAFDGWNWLARAASLFAAKPLSWFVLCAGMTLVFLLLAITPVLGVYAFHLLTPLIVAGMLTAASDIEAGRSVGAWSFFRGFRHQTSNLIFLGGVNLVGQLLIIVVMVYAGGEELQAALDAGLQGVDPSRMTPEAANRILMSVMLGMALMVPLTMALWFAPSLVMFQGLTGTRALLLSLRACLANLMPFVVYSAITMGLFALALWPRGLGLLLWVPLMTLSLYTSYRDVFPEAAH